MPLSTFLEELLKQRYLENGSSDYVFPGRGGKGHIVDSDHVIRGVAKDADCPFMIHDLRRTFLTMAERLGFSYVVLKKLANHSGKNDTTFGYIVVDIERLREPMEESPINFYACAKTEMASKSRSKLNIPRVHVRSPELLTQIIGLAATAMPYIMELLGTEGRHEGISAQN